MLDRENFKKLFLENYPVLKKRAYYILKNNEAAEDIVQDIFYKLWQKQELDIANYKAYLTRSVINSCLNYLDKHKRMIITEPGTFTLAGKNQTAETLAFNELDSKLKKTLEKLSPQRRTIFSLSLYESMSNQEIADHMGLAKKTIDNQLGSALKQLREELADFVKLLIDFSLLAGALLIFFLLYLG